LAIIVNQSIENGDREVNVYPLVTPDMDEWLKQRVLKQTPVDFGYDTD
jgi:hypothetical protein